MKTYLFLFNSMSPFSRKKVYGREDSETALITMQRHLNRGYILQLLSFVSGD
jgi:hypothetical protein